VVCIACGYDSRSGRIVGARVEHGPSRPPHPGITCPRCGRPIRRGVFDEGQGIEDNTSVAASSHVLWRLVYMALASVVCPICGMIPRREFPPAVRRRLLLQSAGLLLGALALAALLVAAVFMLAAYLGGSPG
jgi:hypothetical protein